MKRSKLCTTNFTAGVHLQYGCLLKKSMRAVMVKTMMVMLMMMQRGVRGGGGDIGSCDAHVLACPRVINPWTSRGIC